MPQRVRFKHTKHYLTMRDTYPNASVRFYASDTILNIDSDAVYLGKAKARSRVANFSIWIITNCVIYQNPMV